MDAEWDDIVDVVAGATQLDINRVSKTGPKTLKKAKEKGRELVREAAVARALTDIKERNCRGRSKVRDAEGNPVLDADGNIVRRPCKNTAIKGGFVCRMHGGSAPNVKRAAGKRLLAMVEPAIIELNELIHQNEHLPSKLGAIKTVLERAGNNAIGALKDASTGDTRPIIQIGIQVGGISPKPEVAVHFIPAPKLALSDVAEGEVADEGDDGE